MVMTKFLSLTPSQLHNALGARRERYFDGEETTAAPDDLLDLDARTSQSHAAFFQWAGSSALSQSDQPKQYHRGSNMVVVEPSGFLLGKHNCLNGVFCENLEHVHPQQSISQSP